MEEGGEREREDRGRGSEGEGGEGGGRGRGRVSPLVLLGEEFAEDVWKWSCEVRGHRAAVWCWKDAGGRDRGLHCQEEVSCALHIRYDL